MRVLGGWLQGPSSQAGTEADPKGCLPRRQSGDHDQGITAWSAGLGFLAKACCALGARGNTTQTARRAAPSPQRRGLGFLRDLEHKPPEIPPFPSTGVARFNTLHPLSLPLSFHPSPEVLSVPPSHPGLPAARHQQDPALRPPVACFSYSTEQ